MRIPGVSLGLQLASTAPYLHDATVHAAIAIDGRSIVECSHEPPHDSGSGSVHANVEREPSTGQCHATDDSANAGDVR